MMCKMVKSRGLFAMLVAMAMMMPLIPVQHVEAAVTATVVEEENFDSGISFTTTTDEMTSTATKTDVSIMKDSTAIWTASSPKDAGATTTPPTAVTAFTVDNGTPDTNDGATYNKSPYLNVSPLNRNTTSAKGTLKHDLASTLTASDGIITVQYRIKFPTMVPEGAAANNWLQFYINESSSTVPFANRTVAKLQFYTDGKMDYVEEYVDPYTAYANTKQTAKDKIGDGQWIYVQMKINFVTQTLELRYGDTLDTLKPWTDSKCIYNLRGSATAPNIARAVGMKSFIFEGHTSVAIDDFKVTKEKDSSIVTTPHANNVTVSGNPNVGQTLTGTYGSYIDEMGRVESGSTYQWYRADDAAFTKNVTAIPGASGSISNATNKNTNSYTLTNDDKGKYIRFGVTPRTKATDTGDVIVGETGYGRAQYAISTLNVGGMVFKEGTGLRTAIDSSGGAYTGEVTFYNTSATDTYNVTVLLARYTENGANLAEIVSSAVTAITPVNGSGVTAAQTVKTPAVNIGATHSGEMLKLFVWDSIQGMKPLAGVASIQ